MNANELADKLQELDSKLHLIELFKSATMLRQQQAELDRAVELYTDKAIENEALKNGLSSAYWHDTFVEVKKPNSDLIYRFKLDETNDS